MSPQPTLLLPSGIIPSQPLAKEYVFQNGQMVIEQHQQPPHQTPEHVLSHHIIAIQTGNAIKVEGAVNGKSFAHQSFPGDFSVLPAGLASWERWDRIAEYIIIRFLPSHSLLHDDDQLPIELHPIKKKYDPLIYQLAQSLIKELQYFNASDPIYIEAVITFITAHLFKVYSNIQIYQSSEKLPLSRLKQVTEYIEDNISTALSVTELAQFAGFSPFHFSRLFKHYTGISPFQYILRSRLERAKFYLSTSNMSVNEIASYVGFANQSHFGRYFKAALGVSPSQFRRKTQE